MCVQIVHELHWQEYGVLFVVPTVVPFRVVEKQVFGELQAVP